MSIEQVVALSAVDQVRADGYVHLLTHSPVTHGGVRIRLAIEDSRVVQAEPILGSMHRGAEKLFESRDYRQVIALANRHEWLSAYSGEVGIAQLLEQALRIQTPQLANDVRTMLLELHRITSHLAFLAGHPWLATDTVKQLRVCRETLVNHLSIYSGSRMHHMLTRIGGLTHAPTNEWLIGFTDALVGIENILAPVQALPENNVGVLSSEDVTAAAVSGPVARASNVAIDRRALTSALSYSNFNVCTQPAGSVRARLVQLVNEIEQSTSLITQLIPDIQASLGSEINVLLPKNVRVPEGDYIHAIETPLGIAEWFLVSRGDKFPYRLKLRPASLNTVLALPQVLIGAHQDDVAAIVASMPFISGDVDR